MNQKDKYNDNTLKTSAVVKDEQKGNASFGEARKAGESTIR